LKYWSHADEFHASYLLKHTANEMLERTTGEQDSSLEPEDPNKPLLKEPSLLPKANMINLYSLKVFGSILTPASPFLPLKAIVLCISCTHNFWPKT